MNTKANITLVASRVARRTYKSAEIQKAARGFILGLELEVIFRGNYTVALLSDALGTVGCGIAKRCPSDDLNEDIGHNIALVRAVEDALICGFQYGDIEEVKVVNGKNGKYWPTTETLTKINKSLENI